ncbi:MAG TPA: NfeD family protein [Phycisphaerae bacterium]|jgi:membrane-bound serine protease (ClpP class)
MTTQTRIFSWILGLLLIFTGISLGQEAAPQRAADAFALPKPLLDPQPKAVIIRLDAEVNDMMLRSVKRRIALAERAGATVVIFEVDTYGGAVTSAIDISKAIKELALKKIITVAWIHNKAISAGAMISASCQHVVMSGAASYGDCAPIAVSTTLTGDHELVPLGAAERAKMQSPVVAEFEDSAAKNGWNKAALTAMVVVEEELHEMRNKNTGETQFVDTKGKDALLAVQEDAPGGIKVHPWEYVSTVDDDKGLLTLRSDLALKMHLSEATVENQEQLSAALNLRSEPITFEFSWAENATEFLTTIGVRFFLFVGMLVFAWLEFSHPGISVFGIAAVLCLVLLIGAPFLTGLAQVWEIALVVLGLGIIIADLLAFGGIGLLAVPGFILMAIGLIASFVPADPNGGFLGSPAAWTAALHGLGVVVGGCFLAAGVFYILAKYLYMTPGFNRLQLVPGGRRGGPALALASGAEAIRDAADRPAGDAVFVGAIGVAATDLRPSGKARFGDHLVPVVSYGSFIQRNTEVLVLEASGMKIVVKPHLPDHNSVVFGGSAPRQTGNPAEGGGQNDRPPQEGSA